MVSIFRSLFMFALVCSSAGALANSKLAVGMKAPTLVLVGENGGLVKDSSEFSVASLAGKPHVIWYVDPDEKDLNEKAVEAQRALQIKPATVGSVAIINFAATIIPNFILSGVIEDSQKENKNTLYVKDLKKILVDTWGLKDDSSNVVVLGSDLKVLYTHGGLLNENNIKDFISVLKKLKNTSNEK